MLIKTEKFLVILLFCIVLLSNVAAKHVFGDQTISNKNTAAVPTTSSASAPAPAPAASPIRDFIKALAPEASPTQAPASDVSPTSAPAQAPAAAPAPAPAQNARILKPGYLDIKTYEALLDDALRISEGGRVVRRDTDSGISFGNTRVYVELRTHYAVNGGAERFSRDSSGIRNYITFDTKVNDKWQLVTMLESQHNIHNYNNIFEVLQRWYARGRLGTHDITMGDFGYLMAEGNIYDSGFTGIRSSFGSPVRYTFSYGETNDTTDTGVFTANYAGDDYDLEAGLYHYTFKDNFWPQNTLITLGGNYFFDNFSLGGMYLNSRVPDEKGNKSGYVFTFKYGDLKTWRKGTYDFYCRYYDQPRGTYIAHTMNGRAASMRGFKGYGAGVNYTVAPNILLNVEYYDLKDKITDERGTTWWNSVSFYF